MAVEGPQADARVARRGRADEVVKRHLIRAGQGQQQLQSRLAVAGSRRDSVLVEMLVMADSSASDSWRCCRCDRSRWPTASSTGSWPIYLLLIRQRRLSTRVLASDGGTDEQEI
jgi:hypothetical protein